MLLLPRVAIEQSLRQIKDYLANYGYECVDLTQQAGQVDAVIISGQDKDMLGMQDITTTAPVINAQGLTPEEVYDALSNQELS